MVKTWTTEKGEDVTCPVCGSVYEVTVTRFPARERGSFHCAICGEQLNKWSGTHDYSYRLLKEGKVPEDD